MMLKSLHLDMSRGSGSDRCILTMITINDKDELTKNEICVGSLHVCLEHARSYMQFEPSMLLTVDSVFGIVRTFGYSNG